MSVDSVDVRSPAAALLAMRGVRMSFAAGEVLHGVDFTLRRGEIHALVGQNGAGKSTLMKVLGGVYPEHVGEVSIEGESVRLVSPREALDAGVAVIYQEFALAPDLTVSENIGLGREPESPGRGLIDRRGMRERSAKEAAEFGIALPLDRPIRELGVAEQQLTEVVRALARRARILVMDEPTARLSPAERDRLFETMRQLRGTGVGIVYISHFLEEVFAVADVVTVLRDGNVVATRATADLDLPSLAALMVGSELAETVRDLQSERDIAAEPALQLDAVSVAGRAPVTFAVRPGEIVGLAGLVGSGRTRLARSLVGIGRRTGSVRLAGRTVRFRSPAEAARAGLLMLPEDRKRDGLVMAASVATNVTLTALDRSLTRLGFVRRAARAKLAGALIEQFRILPPNPQRVVRTLSGGNQQKALMARAFGANARVLLLDQPTAGVDVGAKAELYERITELSRAGVGMVLISDDLDELLLLADSIVVMHAGAAVGMRPTREFTRERLLAAITTGSLEQAA